MAEGSFINWWKASWSSAEVSSPKELTLEPGESNLKICISTTIHIIYKISLEDPDPILNSIVDMGPSNSAGRGQVPPEGLAGRGLAKSKRS